MRQNMHKITEFSVSILLKISTSVNIYNFMICFLCNFTVKKEDTFMPSFRSYLLSVYFHQNIFRISLYITTTINAIRSISPAKWTIPST